MEWHDEGIILHTQDLGERKQVVSIFTATHGRCAGVLHTSQKNKGWAQCGTKVKARWGARLESHIGSWQLESLQANSAFLFDAPGPLAALLSIAALCHLALPERQAYPQLYNKFEALIKDLLSPGWARSYIFFELSLLEELGYGLDLKACAVTGEVTNLVAVSPRTGRAVCEEAAKPYKEKLLPLPSFLHQEYEKLSLDNKEILDGLRLSGYFLERYLLDRALPSARVRLVQQFNKER